RADLQVILQVRPDARCVDDDLDSVPTQQVGRTDARKLQDLRRADTAGAQDHFACRLWRHHLAAVPYLRARTSRAAVGSGCNDDARYLRVGPQLEVGSSVTGRSQKSLRGVPAPAVFLIDFEVADAFVAATIKIV